MIRQRREFDDSTYDGQVARRIRELRQKCGFSVEEILDKIASVYKPISKFTYYKWEAGKGAGGIELPIHIVPVLCEVFGVSVAEFMPEMPQVGRKRRK